MYEPSSGPKTLAAHAAKRRPMTQRKMPSSSEGFSLSVADPDIQALVDSLAYAA